MSARTWSSDLYPKRTGDVGRDRNARAIQFACFLLAIAIAIVVALDTISREPLPIPTVSTAMAGLVVAAIVNRSGRPAWAARIVMLALLLCAILRVVAARDGFRSHAMLMFPGVLLLSVMLLDRASYMITAGIVLLTVTALGIAEKQGLFGAIPPARTPTNYESIFLADLTLLVFSIVGARIARDIRRNAFDLRAGIDQLTAANLELQRAEEALRESEQQLVSIYNTVQDVIFYLAVEPDGQFRFVSVNAAFLKVTGLNREAVVGKTVQAVIPEPSLTMVLEKYRRAIEERTAVFWEETSDYPTGQLTGEVSITPVLDNNGICSHLVGSVHDITDRKRAEAERERLRAELSQSQKMESLGRLAGGVAHDFNNLMSIILMNADSAFEELRCGDSALTSVTAIRETADRAVALGRQLMTFSSRQMLQTEALDLNSVVAESQSLVARLIGEDVRVVFKPGSGLDLVRADRGQIGQIIMNLAVNSRDAMPEGGTLTIETARVEVDESSAQLNPDSKPGAYAMLAVRDTGIGMDQETQARAFEPFFTTKGVGKGTGLGLPVVYGIVKQSGGFITVTSEPGQGAKFKICLPAVLGIPEPIPVIDEGRIRGGSETVLLVEDEPALRQKVREVLKKAGYHVLVARDGNQGLVLALEEHRSIHLLLTDVVMPEMSGSRLSESLRRRYPETKVLYMSGYPNAGSDSLELQSQPNFIQKPFTKEGLLRRVRDVLDASDTAGAAM
jgi:PAS domain S-box-containing protein